MGAPELIKRLGRETKIQVLVAEAQACDFSTSELAELLDLLVAGPTEKSALSLAVLEALAGAGTPAGRIEDLRKAFGAPGLGTVRTSTPPAGAQPTRPAVQNMPIRGSASQQTRPVQSPFRARFDAGRPAEPPAATAPDAPESATEPPLPPPPSAIPTRPGTGVSAPAAPRAPLPLRGKAAEILKSGAGTAVPPAPPRPAPTPPPSSPPPLPPLPTTPAPGQRVGIDPGKGKGMFFGDGKSAPSTQSVLGAAAARPMVLLADDDKRIRMVYRLKLEEKGYAVVEAADGLEAWKRLEVGGISAAVLDMKMPGLHGLEILSRLADSGQNLPVVVCTAYDRLDDEFVVATYPKLRYLTKPVDAEQLSETLNNLLAE